MHANSGSFVNDAEAGLLQDIEEWLNQQALVRLAEGKLELGAWQPAPDLAAARRRRARAGAQLRDESS